MTSAGPLTAVDVSWRRGDRLILDGVGVTAEAGTTVGVLGPNGSGKSSLLRILAGLSRPDSGTVTLGGVELATLRRREVARSVAMVEQAVHTEVDVTVADVVALGRIPHRRLLDVDPANHPAVHDALAAADITHLRNRHWHTLSGGERQRVQIARALAQEPTCLLLDEPTNHLDIQHQLDLLELVEQTSVTSYIALHDLNLAAMFCDRVTVLSAGRVVAAGRPVDVITEDLVREVYGVQAAVTVDDGVPVVCFRRSRHRSQTNPPVPSDGRSTVAAAPGPQ